MFTIVGNWIQYCYIFFIYLLPSKNVIMIGERFRYKWATHLFKNIGQ